MTNQTCRVAVAGLLTAPLLLSACSQDSDGTAGRPDTGNSSPASSSPASSPAASSAPPKPSLLSGRPGRPDGPVYAVKVDNTAKAHPQVGLSKADVVYVEQVEGGVTRLAAIFSSAYPRRVGPVRSGRITDIDLLRQYGTVGLMYSGSQTKLFPDLRRARLKLVSYDADHTGYIRASSRPMPYDVIGDFAALRKRAGKVSRPTRVRYAFGPAPSGGHRATNVTVQYPFARLGAHWSPARKRYLLSMDGAKDLAGEGGRLGATTLVVQFCTLRPSRFYDVNGVNTPLTETVGRGRALFFRDGKVFRGTWRRAKAARPTAYTIGGKRAVLAPGQLWVALVGRDRPVTFD